MIDAIFERFDVPYSIVALEATPWRCSSSWIASQFSALTLFGQIFLRVSSAKISAPPPLTLSSPASLSSATISAKPMRCRLPCTRSRLR